MARSDPHWPQVFVVETYKSGTPKEPRSLNVVGVSEGLTRVLGCPHVVRRRGVVTMTVELNVNDLRRLLDAAGRDRI